MFIHTLLQDVSVFLKCQRKENENSRMYFLFTHIETGFCFYFAQVPYREKKSTAECGLINYDRKWFIVHFQFVICRSLGGLLSDIEYWEKHSEVY